MGGVWGSGSILRLGCQKILADPYLLPEEANESMRPLPIESPPQQPAPPEQDRLAVSSFFPRRSSIYGPSLPRTSSR